MVGSSVRARNGGRWLTAVVLSVGLLAAACFSDNATPSDDSTATSSTAESTATSLDQTGEPDRTPDGERTEIVGVDAACSDRALQVPGDPYSPPCRSWDGGANGGATSRGVDATAVRVAVPLDLVTFPGEDLAVVERTYDAYVEYLNAGFEFYGRELELVVDRDSTTPAEAAAFADRPGSFIAPLAIDSATITEFAARGIVTIGVGDELPDDPLAYGMGVPDYLRDQPQSTIAYEVFKVIDPASEPTVYLEPIYYALYVTALGIQGAGPDLTPDTFAAGLAAYPPTDGPIGVVSFADDDLAVSG